MPERRYYRKTYQKSKRKFGFFLKFFFFVFLFLIFSPLSLFIYYAKDLPRPEKFIERQLFESTRIYDRSGEILLYEIYGEEKRAWVPLKKIPEYLKEAIIATEDANFYQHPGIDFKGIINAVLANLRIMKPIYGGSTIPQQLIRSTFLSLEKTAERKTREIILSLELDRRYSKEQILEWYLNQIPFGRNAYGVEAASQTYFRKSVWEISLAEAATLAALIKAPSFYSMNLDELLIRKDYVLNRMVSEGFLSQEEAEAAKKEEINIIELSQPILAPHFTLWVKQQLEEKYGREFLEQRGLKILTTLDWELQQMAEKIVKEGVKNNKIYNSHNAALVAINPKTGEILAMVGSADYFGQPYPKDCTPGLNCKFDPKFNAVVGTKNLPGRQPGSAFKPFVYVTAFQKGYSDKTIVDDSPTCWPQARGSWCPQNFDGLFRGPVTLRSALAQSLNVPSVKVLDSLAGYLDSIKTAQAMGITTLEDPKKYGLSIVLGGAEVKLLDMASAYGVLANDGLRVPPNAILKIEDSKGKVIFENKKTPMRVLESKATRLINDVLSDNEARTPMFGPRSNLYFENYQVAAKTGTSQDSRDGWLIGYTPSIVTGVWVGNNDNTPMLKKAAELLAGPIFNKFMKKALLKYPPENFLKPEF
ncbi:MAG: PBP1A family penicillin-binding protein [Patescibacteria group bacterium]|nr:PBP1A family penicillin-binding protein [Patescibacteria group bacterium]